MGLCCAKDRKGSRRYGQNGATPTEPATENLLRSRLSANHVPVPIPKDSPDAMVDDEGVPALVLAFGSALRDARFEDVMALCADDISWQTPLSGTKKGKAEVLAFLEQRHSKRKDKGKYKTGWRKRNDTMFTRMGIRPMGGQLASGQQSVIVESGRIKSVSVILTAFHDPQSTTERLEKTG